MNAPKHLDVAWSQIQGRRSSQQDTAAVSRWENGFHLLLLADGMGGHAGGAEASSIVINTVKHEFAESSNSNTAKERLIKCAQQANQALFDYVDQHPELEGMGSTLIAVAFDGDSIEWLSIGDSPLWLIRQGKIQRLNQDHSMAAVLDEKARRGEIEAEEARSSPLRSQLLSAVMGEDIDLVDFSEKPLPLRDGDILILASDGVESLELSTITDIVIRDKQNSGAAKKVEHLLEAIIELGCPHQDNATLILSAVKT